MSPFPVANVERRVPSDAKESMYLGIVKPDLIQFHSCPLALFSFFSSYRRFGLKDALYGLVAYDWIGMKSEDSFYLLIFVSQEVHRFFVLILKYNSRLSR